MTNSLDRGICSILQHLSFTGNVPAPISGIYTIPLHLAPEARLLPRATQRRYAGSIFAPLPPKNLQSLINRLRFRLRELGFGGEASLRRCDSSRWVVFGIGDTGGSLRQLQTDLSLDTAISCSNTDQKQRL